jgi:hypothetical protein
MIAQCLTTAMLKDRLSEVARQLDEIHLSVYHMPDYEEDSGAMSGLCAYRIQREIYELQSIIRELDT